MERIVPSTASEEVELYQRTYYSLLRSTAEVQIRSLEEVHAGMNSLMHPLARDQRPDMSAFIYSLLRLPACISRVQLVVMGQSAGLFARAGFSDLDAWQPVSAAARRRRCFFNGKDTLACFIASRSDIDDLIPLLTAHQIEWNKLHFLLHRLPSSTSLAKISRDADKEGKLAKILEISEEDVERLMAIWGDDFDANLQLIAAGERRLRVRLLSGSLTEYRRAVDAWWGNILRRAPELDKRPVYFVSSNTHSMLNILSGFALGQVADLEQFLKGSENTGLLAEWQDIQSRRVPSSRENFIYYVFRKYQQTPKGQALKKVQQSHEHACGIVRVPSQRSFDVEAQVFEIGRLRPEWLDPRMLQESWSEILTESNALILNIDYPLGLAAYDILTGVASSVGSVLGVYIMGKSAALNAVVGDVMISNVVHDEHSRNTYLLPNCYSTADVTPWLVYGTVLDNQKSVTVQGTFLQTAHYMDIFYREGYTDIEMEAGPYLSAVFEMYRPERHPVNEIVNLYGLPFDLGMIHYVSDTPLSKGRNLGAGSLSYFGMDSTYAASLAILRRIFQLERQRLGKM